MFSFLSRRRARPPLSPLQRMTLELFVRRNRETLGTTRSQQIEVATDLDQLHLDKSTPQRLLASAADAVTQWMDLDVPPPQYRFIPAEQLNYPATYTAETDNAGAVISVAEETLSDPLSTVMELAYQISCHFWTLQPGDDLLDVDPRNVHLTPIGRGLGVLASDASLRDDHWSASGFAGWSLRRCGYYNAQEIGYALALWCRAGGQTSPSWLPRLRTDSQVTFRRASGYFHSLDAQGGSLLLDAPRIPTSETDMTQLADWLRGTDPVFALAAAAALRHHDQLSPLAIDAALVASSGGDRDLRLIATDLLGSARVASTAVHQRLQQLIHGRNVPLSLAALRSAARLHVPLAPFAPRIGKLLDSPNVDVISLLRLIAGQGTSLAMLTPRIGKMLPRAARQDDNVWVDAIIEALLGISANPLQAIDMQAIPAELAQRLQHTVAHSRQAQN